MTRRPRTRSVALLVLAGLVALSTGAAAADFPPITAEQKALTQVPGEPNAPAVVLFHQGELQMEVHGKLSDSVYVVRKRIKVLTEDGKEYGEIRLPHGRYSRLKRLEGRTVLADGTVLELQKDDVFKRRSSRRDDYFVTAAALPGVAVGAILDYEIELRLESIFVSEPWTFQEHIPTLLSEISYVVPEHIGFHQWSKAIPQKLEVETEKQPRGRTVHARMRGMPSIPDEPYGFPTADLSNQFMILPTEYVISGSLVNLLVSWERTVELYEDFYRDHRKNDGVAKQRAKELAAAAGGDKRAQAEAVYRFVRDEIAPLSFPSVSVFEGDSVDKVIADGRGTSIDQALVLQAMLDALKIDADLLWVADRDAGKPDLNTPNPGWFSGAVVRAALGGETVYLDPSDPGLAFGQLRPDVEGTEALVFDRRKPEVVALPTAPFDQNVRRAEVALALDDAGRLTGEGTLRLTGQHAWQVIDGEGTAEENAKEWQETFEGWFDDFAVSDVTVEEAADERRVVVAWKMAQPEEEVLGDESTISPSRPLGPIEQPFKTAQRQTPARFDFIDRDEVELTVTWPESWQVAAAPRGWDFMNDAGAVAASVEVDEAARRLRYTRRFDVTKQQFVNSTELGMVRQLFSQVSTNDAQSLLLTRR